MEWERDLRFTIYNLRIALSADIVGKGFAIWVLNLYAGFQSHDCVVYNVSCQVQTTRLLICGF